MKHGRLNLQNGDGKSVVLLCIDDTLQAKYVEATLTKARHLVKTADGPRVLFDMLGKVKPYAVVLGATNALFDGKSLARLVRENTPYLTGQIYLADPEGVLHLASTEDEEGRNTEFSMLPSAVSAPLSSAAA